LRAQKETRNLSANSDRRHQDRGAEQEPPGSGSEKEIMSISGYGLQ
jgi:hypothetical protein